MRRKKEIVNNVTLFPRNELFCYIDVNCTSLNKRFIIILNNHYNWKVYKIYTLYIFLTKRNNKKTKIDTNLKQV